MNSTRHDGTENNRESCATSTATLGDDEAPITITHHDTDDAEKGGALSLGAVLGRVTTKQDEAADDMPRATNTVSSAPVHSVFTKNQKRFIVVMASWAGFFSPVSGTIYFPALNSLARDLHVSTTLINLTLTSYMVRFSLLCGGPNND